MGLIWTSILVTPTVAEQMDHIPSKAGLAQPPNFAVTKTVAAKVQEQTILRPLEEGNTLCKRDGKRTGSWKQISTSE